MMCSAKGVCLCMDLERLSTSASSVFTAHKKHRYFMYDVVLQLVMAKWRLHMRVQGCHVSTPAKGSECGKRLSKAQDRHKMLKNTNLITQPMISG